MHDRVAELRGLRAEHDRHAQYGRTDRAGQVAEHLDRVSGELEEEIERLEDRAAQFAENGQDIPAGEAAAAARTLRTELDALTESAPAPRTTTGKGAKSTAAAPAPAETTARD